MSVQLLYNTYLRQLSIQERLELIRLLVDETIVVQHQHSEVVLLHDVMDFAGAGQADAMEEDAQAYVDNLRSEWAIT